MRKYSKFLSLTIVMLLAIFTVSNGDTFATVNNSSKLGSSESSAKNVVGFGFANNTLFVATMSNGVFESQDNGQTWEPVPDLPQNLQVTSVSTLHNKGRDVVYLATYYHGIFQYSDQSKQWVAVNQNLPQRGDDHHVTVVASYADDNNDAEYIMAYSDQSSTTTPEGGVAAYVSVAGGAWQEIYNNYNTDYAPYCLAIDPNNSSNLYIGLHATDPEAYITLLASSDAGKTWSERLIKQPTLPYGDIGIQSLLVDNQGNLYASAESLYKYSPITKSWSIPSGAPGETGLLARGNDQNTLYMLSAQGPYRDNLYKYDGQDWIHMDGVGEAKDGVTAFAAIQANNCEYAGTQFSKIYVSCDNGSSWKQLSSPD